MGKTPVFSKSHEEMIREYPINGLVKDWFFRVREVSNGVFRVEGSDVYGRTVSRIGTENDSKKLLDDCVAYAKLVQVKAEPIKISRRAADVVSQRSHQRVQRG